MTDTTTRTIIRREYDDRPGTSLNGLGLAIVIIVVVFGFLFFLGGHFNTPRQDDRADLTTAGDVYHEIYSPSPANIMAAFPPPAVPAPVIAAPAAPVIAPPATGGVARPDGPGRCILSAPYQGVHGYIWGDGRCHLAPPSGASVDPISVPGPGISGGDRCRMKAPYAGRLGYAWGDGRCHSLPRQG